MINSLVWVQVPMCGKIRELNTAFEQGPTTKQSEALRCETMPALILVGY